jgi:hypothetical protein
MVKEHKMPPKDQWKTQVYVFGALLGSVFGFISAYFYARAAEEELVRTGGKPHFTTPQIIGLLLAGLTLIRQISESGKPARR